jgi:hypothetical protein
VAVVQIAVMTPTMMPPITMAPVAMMPISMTTPTAMSVSAVAIAVPPPAAITCFLHDAGLIGFQRNYAGRKRCGARARGESPECQNHRAA